MIQGRIIFVESVHVPAKKLARNCPIIGFDLPSRYSSSSLIPDLYPLIAHHLNQIPESEHPSEQLFDLSFYFEHWFESLGSSQGSV